MLKLILEEFILSYFPFKYLTLGQVHRIINRIKKTLDERMSVPQSYMTWLNVSISFGMRE